MPSCGMSKDHTRANGLRGDYNMRNLLSAIIVILFMITGCSVESIFTSGAFEWLFCFLVLIIIAWVYFGGRE